MGQRSKNDKARKTNGKEGGRPSLKNSEDLNNLIDELSDILVHYDQVYTKIFEDKDDDMIEIMDEMIEKIEDIFVENTIENYDLQYEIDLCDRFDKLILEIDINNRLLFKNYDNKFKGITPNYGIRKGCGVSKTTLYKRKIKADALESSAAGSKLLTGIYKPVESTEENNNGYDNNNRWP